MPFRIGQYCPLPGDDRSLQVLCDAPELQGHVDKPWFRAYIATQAGVPTAALTTGHGDVSLPGEAVACHSVVCGATGSGKSRLLLHLLREQLRSGGSAVLIDPKGETSEQLLYHAQQSGLSSEQVTVLDPRSAEGAPGWNPLAAGLPPEQAVGDMVALLEQSHSSWGPRLDDILTNGLLVLAAHGLSLYELGPLLLREEYRAALLSTPTEQRRASAASEAHRFFRDEFAGWSRGERASAVAPVMNKVRELLRSQFLCPLLCARRNTLDLARMWHEPHLVVVRLDRAALGEQGARLLAGLLVHLLFRTALRSPGPLPVMLAVDELPVVERFVGAALSEIVTIARSQRLRLVVACQHLSQVSDGLRAALLANAGVQAYFRLGHADGKLVAGALAVGNRAVIRRATAGLDPHGIGAWIEWPHRICDPYGRPLRLNEPAMAQFASAPREEALETLRSLSSATGIPRLYVHAPDTGEPVALSRYVQRVPAYAYRIEGPALRLVVQFPRPRLSGFERTSEADAVREWTRQLLDLPRQHAVVRIAGGSPAVVRIVDVPVPDVDRDELHRFTAAALHANGQSADEVEAAMAQREREIERCAARRADHTEPRMPPAPPAAPPGEKVGRPRRVPDLAQAAIREAPDD